MYPQHQLPQAPIPAGKTYGHWYTSFILHAPHNILHLASVLRAKNVLFVRTTLDSLDDIHSLPGVQVGQGTVLVNASGLGARWLKGVKDE